jgi:peptide/nickel transport system ATP-binding protein
MPRAGSWRPHSCSKGATSLRSMRPPGAASAETRIAMIFQDPMMTLNPVLRIDTQMVEAVRAHHEVSVESALARCREALARVGIASPDERLRCYPHHFSGGHAPAVAIAIALLNKPDLIIADEPTTALDVTIQGQILFEMQKLCRESGAGLIWISHDLSVISGLADEVCVMYAGGSSSRVGRAGLERPLHPYTRGLLDSVPARNVPEGPLAQIPGMTPSLARLARRAPSASAARARSSRARWRRHRAVPRQDAPCGA